MGIFDLLSLQQLPGPQFLWAYGALLWVSGLGSSAPGALLVDSDSLSAFDLALVEGDPLRVLEWLSCGAHPRE